MREVRQDTGEVLRERAATRDELQRSLPDLIEEAGRDAYYEGLDAAAAVTPLEANPYPDGVVDWQCRADGWNSLTAEGAEEGVENGDR